MKLPSGALLFFPLMILCSGCEDREMPDLGGHYSGTLVTSTAQQSVVADIPASTTTNGKGTITFSFFEVTPTASPNSVSVAYDAEMPDKLVLTGATFNDLPIQLDRVGSCADGKIARAGNQIDSISLCWTQGTVEIVRKGPAGDLLIGLHLIRDDGLPKFGTDQRDLVLSMDDAVGRARFSNYKIEQQAEQLYRARNNIQIARKAVLPRLSGRTILSAILFPTTGFGLVDAIGNLVPFIFPGGWYKVDEEQYTADAQKASYLSLTANEMNLVETLYYAIARDQELLALMDAHIARLADFQLTVLKQKQLGLASADALTPITDMLNDHRNDREVLRYLLTEELSNLSISLAVQASNGVTAVRPIVAPDLSKEPEIQPGSFVTRAQLDSLEIESLKDLLRAAAAKTQATTYGVVNPSDFISLDFGYFSEVKNAISDEREISAKIDEIFASIDEKGTDLASQYNLGIRNAARLSDTLQSKSDALKALQDLSRTTMIDVQKIVAAESDVFEAKSRCLTNAYGFLITRAQLDRLRLQGYYRGIRSLDAPTEPGTGLSLN